MMSMSVFSLTASFAQSIRLRLSTIRRNGCGKRCIVQAEIRKGIGLNGINAIKLAK